MSRRLPVTISLVAWTLVVWTTRIGNIWNDADLTDGEKWGRTGLAMSFTVLALAVAHGVHHRAGWRGLAVKALAGWTIGVWVTRSFGIATGDHQGAFIAVHLVLAMVSSGLSVLAVREESRSLERVVSDASPG